MRRAERLFVITVAIAYAAAADFFALRSVVWPLLGIAALAGWGASIYWRLSR